MPVEFFFEGEEMTLATDAEFKRAVLLGRLVSRGKHFSTYEYGGHRYLISDIDLSSYSSAIRSTKGD